MQRHATAVLLHLLALSALQNLFRESRARHARAYFRERRLARRRDVIVKWREAAIVSSPELVHRDELSRFQYAVSHFLWRLNARIDRSDDSDEHPMLRLKAITDQSQNPDSIRLTR